MPLEAFEVPLEGMGLSPDCYRGDSGVVVVVVATSQERTCLLVTMEVVPLGEPQLLGVELEGPGVVHEEVEHQRETGGGDVTRPS